MWYIVRLDSSRVAALVKVRSATLVSSSDPTRVKSNYIPVETTILRQIERCHVVSRHLMLSGLRPIVDKLDMDTKNKSIRRAYKFD